MLDIMPGKVLPALNEIFSQDLLNYILQTSGSDTLSGRTRTTRTPVNGLLRLFSYQELAAIFPGRAGKRLHPLCGDRLAAADVHGRCCRRRALLPLPRRTSECGGL